VLQGLFENQRLEKGKTAPQKPDKIRGGSESKASDVEAQGLI